MVATVDWGHGLKVEPEGVADGLDVRCKGKRS